MSRSERSIGTYRPLVTIIVNAHAFLSKSNTSIRMTRTIHTRYYHRYKIYNFLKSVQLNYCKLTVSIFKVKMYQTKPIFIYNFTFSTNVLIQSNNRSRKVDKRSSCIFESRRLLLWTGGFFPKDFPQENSDVYYSVRPNAC